VLREGEEGLKEVEAHDLQGAKKDAEEAKKIFDEAQKKRGGLPGQGGAGA